MVSADTTTQPASPTSSHQALSDCPTHKTPERQDVSQAARRKTSPRLAKDDLDGFLRPSARKNTLLNNGAGLLEHAANKPSSPHLRASAWATSAHPHHASGHHTHAHHHHGHHHGHGADNACVHLLRVEHPLYRISPIVGRDVSLETRKALARIVLAQDSVDTSDLNEIAVCCQGTALDLDELLGLVVTLLGDKKALLENVALIIASVPGIYYGIQNWRGSHITFARLDRLRAALEADTSVVAQLEVSGAKTHASSFISPLVLRPQQAAQNAIGKNLAAQKRTVQESISLQRFVSWFDGALPIASSMATLTSLVFAPFSGIAGGLLVAYCGSHVVRYAAWDLRHQHATAVRQEAAPGSDLTAAHGEEAHQAIQKKKKQVLGATIASFAVYGLGASALLAASLGNLVSLAGFGLVAMLAGMGAVLVLNNGPVKQIYGKNSKEKLARINLGGEIEILRRLGRTAVEHAAIARLSSRCQTLPNKTHGFWTAVGRQCLIGAFVTLNYATATLGLTGVNIGSSNPIDPGSSALLRRLSSSWQTMVLAVRAWSDGLEQFIGSRIHALRTEQVIDSPQRAAALAETARVFRALENDRDVAGLGDAAHDRVDEAGAELWRQRALNCLDILRISGRDEQVLASLAPNFEDEALEPGWYDLGTHKKHRHARFEPWELYRTLRWGSASEVNASKNNANEANPGLSRHIALGISPGQKQAQSFVRRLEVATVMALIYERRADAAFELGALSDHLHARRRLGSEA